MRQILNNKRPVNLALTTLKFPPMAIVSILHRLSGLLLACLIPVVLLLFHLSLNSKATFELLQSYAAHPLSKLVLWFCLSSLIYHLLAGFRHMIMDSGVGESVTAAKSSSIFLIVLNAIVAVALGVWLW